LSKLKLFSHSFLSSANQQSLGQMKELDVNSQVLYQLAQYLQV